jgi:hypothetical protein
MTRTRTVCRWTHAAFIVAVLLFLSAAAQAQTFAVLYTLNGTTDGKNPGNGLVSDRGGNLYGVASLGGTYPCPDNLGCGTIFRLSPHGTGWIFSVVYSFTGVSDGWNPEAPLAVAPDGSIYGTTFWGGINGCTDDWGCGTIFKLAPPPTVCPTASCGWIKTTLYKFTGGADGQYPLGQITFDQAGNLYGTASASNPSGQYAGSVFGLTPSAGGWTFNVLYAFPGTTSGAPVGGVIFDSQGNLWGVQAYGGVTNCGDPQLPDPCGSIYELSPSASGWTETTVFEFSASTGGCPSGTLVPDHSGNFYGTLCTNGPSGSGGIFQYVPPSGEFNIIHSIAGNPADDAGPYGGVVMDHAGNLYAADQANGTYDRGFVFELSPSNGSWVLTSLHNFTGHSDGSTPYGPLVVDAEGNVYGADLTNVIFEITP